MRVIYLSGGNCPAAVPCVATIGFFDGVHLGHRHIIANTLAHAGKSGMQSCAVTFGTHPRQVVQPGYHPQLLTTLDEKLDLLSGLGVDTCVVLSFDDDMAAMDASCFMRSILYDRLGVRQLIIGYDNRFGHGRTDTFDDYVRYGREMGMAVTPCDEALPDGLKVSSSVIRQRLLSGDVEAAGALLGYHYQLTGKVVPGMHQGRLMGFPTANMAGCGVHKLVPANGVYAVKAVVGDRPDEYMAIMNIGKRPTFDGHEVTLETHILNMNEDIYGQTMTVRFMHRMRDEKPFDGMDSLARQLRKDRDQAIEWFANHNESK